VSGGATSGFGGAIAQRYLPGGQIPTIVESGLTSGFASDVIFGQVASSGPPRPGAAGVGRANPTKLTTPEYMLRGGVTYRIIDAFGLLKNDTNPGFNSSG